MGFEIGSRSEMQIGFLSGIAKFIESLLKKTAGAISKDFPPHCAGCWQDVDVQPAWRTQLRKAAVLVIATDLSFLLLPIGNLVHGD